VPFARSFFSDGTKSTDLRSYSRSVGSVASPLWRALPDHCNRAETPGEQSHASTAAAGTGHRVTHSAPRDLVP
jgi:hypothetical protein